MSGLRLYLLLSITAFSVFAATGCGGRVTGEQTYPMALLKQGKFAEARTAALTQGIENNGHRAIVAISHIAENPSDASAKQAVTVLSETGDDVRAAVAAAEMLALVSELSPPPDTKVSLLLAEAALGATHHGPLSPAATPSITVGAAGRDLAIAVLERVADALVIPGASLDDGRLLGIWNGCFSLDGGSFEAKSDLQAWRLYKSIATLALFVSNDRPEGDFARVLLGAAISVVENNPDIAVAARCDLSSPFDPLKTAMAHNREGLGRLERAVINAAGCTRGTYAPTAP